MYVFFVLIAVILLIAFEKKWAPKMLSHLSVSGSCSKLMAEPGEQIAITIETSNSHHVFPIFTRTIEYLPKEADLGRLRDIMHENCFELKNSLYVNRSFYLAPRRIHRADISFSINRRGKYSMGIRDMAAGDLLGLSELKAHFDDNTPLVILPKASDDLGILRVLGSFLGDISVRRFILEDPVMTVGFNDYTGREPMKQISWSRSAIAGTLMVRNYDHTVDQTVVVVTNVNRSDESEFESLLSVTRTVCEQLEDRHIPFSFYTNMILQSPTCSYDHLADGLGSAHLNRVLYSLGAAEHTCLSSLETLISKVKDQNLENTSCIVITPALESYELRSLSQLCSLSDGSLCLLDVSRIGGAE